MGFMFPAKRLFNCSEEMVPVAKRNPLVRRDGERVEVLIMAAGRSAPKLTKNVCGLDLGKFRANAKFAYLEQSLRRVGCKPQRLGITARHVSHLPCGSADFAARMPSAYRRLAQVRSMMCERE
jgi:hypothetical protein